MKDIHEITEVLYDFNRLNRKKRRKFISRLLFDKDFIKWLFQPEKSPTLSQDVEELYKGLTQTTTLDAILEAIEYAGYSKFNRSHATFITTVCNIAIERNNKDCHERDKARRDYEVSRTRLRPWGNAIDESNELIVKLLKRAKRIIKKDAYETARDARLPKYIAIAAYTSIPEPKYVDRFKIGFYLNNLLNTIYSDVEEHGEFLETVRWKDFFEDIFGANNVVECATFILLEGVHRIDKYRNSEDVCICWDTLTDFALSQLNKAPDNMREQMVELYLKRLDKMFSNKAFDLRTNLLEVPKMIWPNLWKTVQKYADRLLEILKRGCDDK